MRLTKKKNKTFRRFYSSAVTHHKNSKCIIVYILRYSIPLFTPINGEINNVVKIKFICQKTEYYDAINRTDTNNSPPSSLKGLILGQYSEFRF